MSKVGDYWKSHINKTNMNYEKDYGGVDYTDAVVLDVGCSFHTPDFFLDKGAKHVIGIEAMPSRMETIIKYAEKFGTVTPITKWIKKVEHLEEIYLAHPEITHAKYDCDGCETVIIDMKPEIFRIPKYYVMEVHQHYLPVMDYYDNPKVIGIYQKLLDKFEECGYEIISASEGPPAKVLGGRVSAGNIKAVRKDD